MAPLSDWVLWEEIPFNYPFTVFLKYGQVQVFSKGESGTRRLQRWSGWMSTTTSLRESVFLGALLDAAADDDAIAAAAAADDDDDGDDDDIREE